MPAFLLSGERDPMPKLDEYLTVSQAAEFLGIPVYTLRNWVEKGKLPAHRNPMNNYRLLKKTDLDDLLRQVEHSVSPAKATVRSKAE
jgi:excisionase family DNA binding protein